MAQTFTIRDLVRRLPEDEWRRSHPFSSDMSSVHQVLFHPYASNGQREEAIAAWLQRYQPCLFGRVSAAVNALHYVFLDDDDLRDSDQHIARRIEEGVRAWRQRSVSPRDGVSAPAHGLVVAVVSPRVAQAEPSDVLRQLALELLNVWGCGSTDEPQGRVHWEELYLEHPTDERFVQFTFSVDFFAAAGDGRWWHDHRMPGGVAYTANSVGHMSRYREWYQGKKDQKGWLLETAMSTIALAAETEFGKATWLRPLSEGRPFVTHVSCPLHEPRESLRAFDWTRYAGHLHTDHSVRPEFFRPGPEKSVDMKRKEWVQDFQYLYDRDVKDHIRFVEGVPISKQEVYGRIGRPEDIVAISSPRRPKAPRSVETNISPHDREAELRDLVAVCKAWALTADERTELDGR